MLCQVHSEGCVKRLLPLHNEELGSASACGNNKVFAKFKAVLGFVASFAIDFQFDPLVGFDGQVHLLLSINSPDSS
jgi:hypothetical protein